MSIFENGDLGGTFFGAGRETHERGSRLKGDEVSLQLRGNTQGLIFNSKVADEVRGFKYVTLYKSKITRKLFFVFNNEAGSQLRSYHKMRASVWSKPFVSLVVMFTGIDENCARLHISGNISGCPDLATYEILL